MDQLATLSRSGKRGVNEEQLRLYIQRQQKRGMARLDIYKAARKKYVIDLDLEGVLIEALSPSNPLDRGKPAQRFGPTAPSSNFWSGNSFE